MANKRTTIVYGDSLLENVFKEKRVSVSTLSFGTLSLLTTSERLLASHMVPLKHVRWTWVDSQGHRSTIALAGWLREDCRMLVYIDSNLRSQGFIKWLCSSYKRLQKLLNFSSWENGRSANLLKLVQFWRLAARSYPWAVALLALDKVPLLWESLICKCTP